VEALQQGQKRTSCDLELARVSPPAPAPTPKRMTVPPVCGRTARTGRRWSVVRGAALCRVRVPLRCMRHTECVRCNTCAQSASCAPKQAPSARVGPPAQAKRRQEQLNALTERYLLRRTKEGTIREQLPRKVDHIVFCPLAPIQMRAYRRAPPSTRPALKTAARPPNRQRAAAFSLADQQMVSQRPSAMSPVGYKSPSSVTLAETQTAPARQRFQPALSGTPSVSPAAAARSIDPVCTVLLPCSLSWGSVRLGPDALLFCWHCTHVAVRMRALMRLHCVLGGTSRSVLGCTSRSVRLGEAG